MHFDMDLLPTPPYHSTERAILMYYESSASKCSGLCRYLLCRFERQPIQDHTKVAKKLKRIPTVGHKDTLFKLISEYSWRIIHGNEGDGGNLRAL